MLDDALSGEAGMYGGSLLLVPHNARPKMDSVRNPPLNLCMHVQRSLYTPLLAMLEQPNWALRIEARLFIEPYYSIACIPSVALLTSALLIASAELWSHGRWHVLLSALHV